MVSTIISMYNMELYIKRCVDSLLNQTYPEVEVIIVDDGSTDSSPAMCDRMAEEDSRVKVVHKKNGGNSSARNAGLAVATGDYVLFLDADDYVEPTMFEDMVKFFDDPEVTMVNSGVIATDVNGNTQVHKIKETVVFNSAQAIREYFLGGEIIPSTQCNKLYRREFFDSGIRYNEEVIHEDTEAMPRFLDACNKIVTINEAYYHYIKRPNSASTSKKFNMKGYRILKSMKTHRNMCLKKYRDIVPIFDHYEFKTTYEMMLNLLSCVDHKKYTMQKLALKCRAVKCYIRCMRWPEIKSEYKGPLGEMLVRTVLGAGLSKKFFNLD